MEQILHICSIHVQPWPNVAHTPPRVPEAGAPRAAPRRRARGDRPRRLRRRLDRRDRPRGRASPARSSTASSTTSARYSPRCSTARRSARSTSCSRRSLPCSTHEDIEGFVSGSIRAMIDAVAGDPADLAPDPAAAGRHAPGRSRADRARPRAGPGPDRSAASGGRRRAGGPPIDAEVVSHALIGTAEYFGRMLIEAPDRIEPDRIVATVSAVVLALASPAGRA